MCFFKFFFFFKLFHLKFCDNDVIRIYLDEDKIKIYIVICVPGGTAIYLYDTNIGINIFIMS